jgi:DNA ligase 1
MRGECVLASMACWSVCVPLACPAAEASAPAVMLANVYQDEDSIDLADYWVSEKYDGIRGWWDGHKLLTRSGQRVHSPPWFTAGWPNVPMDGELWIGRRRFEALSAAVRDTVPVDEAWREVKFMVFDLPAHGGAFNERMIALQALAQSLAIPWVQPVEQFKVDDSTALQAQIHAMVAAGGEGLMLHRGSSYYRAARTDDLLKFKLFEDAEARVVGYTPGNGKYEGMVGALLVERPDGTQFKLGTGLTDEQRRHAPPLGSWVTYAYQGVTATGVPRFVRFLRVRE